MDYGQFESRVIELLFKTDQKLTPQLVAFRVGCGVDVARAHLERMTSSEIVSMEVDPDGVIHYDMPGRPSPTNEPLSWQGSSSSVTQSSGAPAGAHVQQHGIAPVHIQINNVPQAHPTVVVVGSEKSVVAAVLLSLLFGPLGMIYSTGIGALVMFFISLVVVPATLGAGLVVTLPAGAIWAANAASEHNRKIRQPQLLLASSR